MFWKGEGEVHLWTEGLTKSPSRFPFNLSKTGNSQAPIWALRPPNAKGGEVALPAPSTTGVCALLFFLSSRKLLFSRQLQLKLGPLTSSRYIAYISKARA